MKERPRQTGWIYYYILMLLQNTACSPAAQTVKAAFSQKWACRRYRSCQARDACFYHFGVLKLEVLSSKRSGSFRDLIIHHSRCPCPAPDSVSWGGESLVAVKSISQHLEAATAALSVSLNPRDEAEKTLTRTVSPRSTSVMCFCSVIDGEQPWRAGSGSGGRDDAKLF